MTITVTPESAVLGATITGVDLAAPLDPTTVAEIREALLRHQVVFFPEAALEPQQQIALGRNFGPVP